MNQATYDKLKNIIVEQLGIRADSVTPQSNIISDLGADSLDRVELLMACEEEFGISILDEQAEGVKTVEEAVALIDGALDELHK